MFTIHFKTLVKYCFVLLQVIFSIKKKIYQRHYFKWYICKHGVGELSETAEGLLTKCEYLNVNPYYACENQDSAHL